MTGRPALPGWARLAVSAALVLGSMLGPAGAEDFPSRPVTLIVPYAAGGTTDIGLRALASATEKHLGQSILIVDKNLKILSRLADRHYVLERGRVRWSGGSARLESEYEAIRRFVGV